MDSSAWRWLAWVLCNFRNHQSVQIPPCSSDKFGSKSYLNNLLYVCMHIFLWTCRRIRQKGLIHPFRAWERFQQEPGDIWVVHSEWCPRSFQDIPRNDRKIAGLFWPLPFKPFSRDAVLPAVSPVNRPGQTRLIRFPGNPPSRKAHHIIELKLLALPNARAQSLMPLSAMSSHA